MSNIPYSKYLKEELILRDELAIDRTILANERTLLSYLRSGVALIISGVSIMYLAQQRWFWIIGLICIPTGILTGIIGIFRFCKMRKAIGSIRNLKAIPSEKQQQENI